LKLGFLVLTTVHATDMVDVAGDSAIRRATFPILYPLLSRTSLAVSLIAWTLYGTITSAGGLSVLINLLGTPLILAYSLSDWTAQHLVTYNMYLVSALSVNGSYNVISKMVT
jgi:hypothetical protein